MWQFRKEYIKKGFTIKIGIPVSLYILALTLLRILLHK